MSDEQRQGACVREESCGQLMRGIYGALTTCARPAGHRWPHNPIYNAAEWEKREADRG